MELITECQENLELNCSQFNDITDTVIMAGSKKTGKILSETSLQTLSDFIKNENSPKAKEMAATLGLDIDDSIKWTSAFQTPQTDEKKGSEQPSTVERLTLHPQHNIRHNVLARSLFSPCIVKNEGSLTHSPVGKFLISHLNSTNESFSDTLAEAQTVHSKSKLNLSPSYARTSTPISSRKFLNKSRFTQILSNDEIKSDLPKILKEGSCSSSKRTLSLSRRKSRFIYPEMEESIVEVESEVRPGHLMLMKRDNNVVKQTGFLSSVTSDRADTKEAAVTPSEKSNSSLNDKCREKEVDLNCRVTSSRCEEAGKDVMKYHDSPTLKKMDTQNRNTVANKRTDCVIDFTALLGEDKGIDAVMRPAKEMHSYQGFQTCTGRKITISATSLQKVQNMWEECATVETPCNRKPAIIKETENGRKYSSKTQNLDVLVMKKTGLQNEEEPLIKPEEKNHSVDLSLPKLSKTDICVNPEQGEFGKKYCGFKTASNKCMVINHQDSLLKAKRLWEDLEGLPPGGTGAPLPAVGTGTPLPAVSTGAPLLAGGTGAPQEASKSEVPSDNRSLSPILGSLRLRNNRMRKSKDMRENRSEMFKRKLAMGSQATMSRGNESNYCFGKGLTTGDSSPIMEATALCNNNNILQKRIMGDFGTQDRIEISKLHEVFMLDDSWDNVGESNSPSSFERPPKLKKLKAHHFIGDLNECRMKQEELLKVKLEEDFRAHPGFLYKLKAKKNSQKYHLSDITLCKKMLSSNSNSSHITPNDAALYRFNVGNAETIDCGEGCKVVKGDDGKVGIEEVEMGFFLSPLICAKMVPGKWVRNHYKWIVWKLSSYQCKVDCFRERPLTLIEMVRQLKYRYDVELEGGKRSVLRKILEQDDLPQKTMVLCVADINVDKNGKANASYLSPLLLTDGWYSVGAQIDNAMIGLIRRHKVQMGYKLIIHGSEIVGCPAPCHPLEADEGVQIKVHTNMVRVARWHTKLGLYSPCGHLPSTFLSNILDDGGYVGTLDFFVARQYPLVHMDRKSGRPIIRSERAHLRKQIEMEALLDARVQEVYSQVVKEAEAEEEEEEDLSQRFEFLQDLPNGKSVSQLIKRSDNLSDLQLVLTEEQMSIVSKWQQERCEERRLFVQREVSRRLTEENAFYEAVSMLKLGIIDRKGNAGVFSIWRPTEEVLESLKEGGSFRIHYASPSEMRNGLKHLTWTKHCRLQVLDPGVSCSSPRMLRQVTPLSAINDRDPKSASHWGEVDIVGMMVKILEPRDGRQMAFLCDHFAQLVILKFWPSVYEQGATNILRVGACLSVCNLSWKGRSEDQFASLHVTPHTAFSNAPSQRYLVDAFTEVKTNLQDPSVALEKVEEFLRGGNLGLHWRR